MAKCFDLVGYNEPCNASRHVPTGRAMLFSAAAGTTGYFCDIAHLTDNGLQLVSMDEVSDWATAVTNYKEYGGNVLPISIEAQNPFNITIQGNTDNGRIMYHKTVHCSLFDDHSSKAEEFIQGMLKSNSAGVLIIERDGTKIADVFGAYDIVKIDPASVTRSEYENGGAWEFDIYCDEVIPNVVSTLAGIKQALDTLLTA